MNLTEELKNYIDDSPVSYFAVAKAEKMMKEAGFEKLDPSKNWKLKENKSYYMTNNESSFIAFKIGNTKENLGFKIIESHTDSPTLRIKSNSIIKREESVLLNVEKYGGLIKSTWFDRPLSMAGRVINKKDGVKPESRIIKIDKNLLIIPSLAIHMTEKEDVTINIQENMLPLIGVDGETSEDLIEEILAKEINVPKENILDYDLYLYDRQKGSIVGLNDEFLSIGRIDNLGSVFTSLKALIDSDYPRGITVIIATDNEEVGSMTKMGANSPMIENTLERILIGLGHGREEFFTACEKSFTISADQAHAVHPNYAAAADPTNRPRMGKGIVIKYSSSKSYSTDGYSAALFKNICSRADVPYQTFYNRSDRKGGSTIGPISQSRVNIRSVDVGAPMLSMHSVRELMHVKDIEYMYRTFKVFFESREI